MSQTESHSTVDKEDDNNQNFESSKNQEGFSFQNRGTHIVNLNIRHRKPKIDLKVLLPESKQINFWGVFETFLNISLDGKILHIGDYTFERKARDACTAVDTNNGGGVVVLRKVRIITILELFCAVRISTLRRTILELYRFLLCAEHIYVVISITPEELTLKRLIANQFGWKSS